MVFMYVYIPAAYMFDFTTMSRVTYHVYGFTLNTRMVYIRGKKNIYNVDI